MARQRHLDLAKLDPIAPDLDLLVQTTEEFQSPVDAVAGPIAGAVEARPSVLGKGIWQERRGGQLRPPRIARAQAVATDVEIAWNSDRAGGEGRIQHVVAGVRDRPPVGDARPAWIELADAEGVGPHRRLGGAAQGHHLRRGEGLPHPESFRQGDRNPVTREQDAAQPLSWGPWQETAAPVGRAPRAPSPRE